MMLVAFIIALLVIVLSAIFAFSQPSEGPSIFLLFITAGIIIPVFPSLLNQVL